MSEEERLKLENELLMTKSKSMMINLYLDKLERIEILNNRVSELEKTVSRKEEQITDLDDENFDLENEIERLNNIINEYDKWLESEIQRLEKFQNPKRGVKPYGQEYNNITFLIGAYDNALDKLQELKGSDKE